MKKTASFLLVLILFICLPYFSHSSFQEGYELYRQGKYYEAEKILLREKELSPKNLDIYAVLGWCYLYTGRYSLAIETCNEGLKLNTRDARFLVTIGRSYLELKRYTDAIGYFEKAISINPDYGYNYFYLGRIFMAQGKLILAETAFSASIMLTRDKYVFYKYRAEVYEKMADYKSAESDYKKALGLKPNDPRLKESLINVITKQSELETGFE